MPNIPWKRLRKLTGDSSMTRWYTALPVRQRFAIGFWYAAIALCLGMLAALLTRGWPAGHANTLAGFAALGFGCLAVYINSAIARAVNERRMMRQELSSAASLQRSLQPTELPCLPGLELGAACRMSREIGGDYFDAIRLGERRILLVIADVSGKGAAAALVMASFQSAVRLLAATEATLTGIAEKIQRLMEQQQTGRYVTAAFVDLDLAAGQLRYLNAGHLAPMLVSDGALTRLDATAVPLGLLPGAAFAEAALPLPASATLLLYTDGITERANEEDEEFGEPRLAAHLTAPPRSAATLVREILAANDHFGGDVPPGDDLTLMVALLKTSASV